MKDKLEAGPAIENSDFEMLVQNLKQEYQTLQSAKDKDPQESYAYEEDDSFL